MRILENIILKSRLSSKEGSLELNKELNPAFLNAPYDILPEFQGPVGRKLRGGRGKDHPRYGRFIYALAKTYKPELVVEVGSYAGGTAIGWATAIKENGKGKLICVDNDTYSKGTYPTVTKGNILKTGINENSFELRNGDSRQIIKEVSNEFKGKVDIYLVDADHTYEGAMADIVNGFPMLKSKGLMLVHDVEIDRKMVEETPEHPHPVHEAFMEFVNKHNLKWCKLKFIRKHLGIIQMP